MSSQPGSPATLDGVLRVPRALTVHRPWAWCWWPVSHPLIHEDPDVTDARDARPISLLEVDWGLVTDAVRFAVAHCPSGPEAIDLDDIRVELPFNLSDDEYAIAQSWVSQGTPVIYRYADDTIEDGRHRLWLAWGHVRGDAVPVLSSSLFYLRDAMTVMPELVPVFTDETLPESVTWWEAAPALVQDYNVKHRRMLAYAYSAVTSPDPVPAEWFARLANWDTHLETLVALRQGGRADPRLLLEALPAAWRYRQDHTAIARDSVLELFRAVYEASGFSSWGEALPRPRGTLTLFRGATAENRHGLSWSTMPATARYFADHRQDPRARGELWQVRVPADRCLMFFPDEDEFVVDLDGLEHLVRKAKPGARTRLSTRAQAAWLRHLGERRAFR
jgi:hypothetical protein